MASVGAQPGSATPASATPAAPAIGNAAYLSSFPVAPAAAASQPAVQTASLSQNEPIFRSLFQAGDRAQPVSPAVQELWGNASSLNSVAPATSVASAGSTTAATTTSAAPSTPAVSAPQSLDLFSDRNGIFSS
jgi:hypothetical protein